MKVDFQPRNDRPDVVLFITDCVVPGSSVFDLSRTVSDLGLEVDILSDREPHTRDTRFTIFKL